MTDPAESLSPTSASLPVTRPQIAALVTEYRQYSHGQNIVDRFLEGYGWESRWHRPKMDVVSLYVDQFPESDLSRERVARHPGLKLYPTIAEALTRGGSRLAVDGVLLIAEHGQYPKNEKGQTLWPRYEFFRETVDVFRASGRSVPVFCDKHLSWEWDRALEMVETSRKLGFPKLAGSSLPVCRRIPSIDMPWGVEIEEIVSVGVGGVDGYDIHSLEAMQCLVERRAGGETGVRRVRCLEGDAVWQAGQEGLYDPKLLEAAIARAKHHSSQLGKRPLEQLVKKPILFHLEYVDGLKANVINLDGAVWEWCAAWCEQGEDKVRSTLFWTQENRPYGHFTFLVQGIEKTFHSGRPAWPIERTLLTTGLLDALLRSKSQAGRTIDTPHLKFSYKTDWKWKRPPPPPKERPSNEQ